MKPLKKYFDRALESLREIVKENEEFEKEKSALIAGLRKKYSEKSCARAVLTPYENFPDDLELERYHEGEVGILSGYRDGRYYIADFYYIDNPQFDGDYERRQPCKGLCPRIHRG